MWEAIASNKRRSWILIGIMGVLLVGLGYVIGAAIYLQFADTSRSFGLITKSYGVVRDMDKLHETARRSEESDSPGLAAALLNTGGLVGAGIAAAVWLVMTLIALGQGDSLLLRTAGAHPIQKEDAPRLWNVVEEMTIASSLGQMPRVYVIEDELPNAFAVGRNPEKAAVAVTSGLLKRLSRDELQGVVAHEIGHVCNLDVRFMTIAAVMVGSIVLMSEFFLRYLWYGGGGRRSRSSRGGGQAQIILLVVGIAAAILAPLVARMLYFACSRRREYLADASAAQFTRVPDGLASALEKISARAISAKQVSRTMAPLYIINPLQSRAAVGLFSTHPPTEKRVKILRSMGGRAGFADYEQAYRQVHGAKSSCLDQRTLGESESIAARQPSPEPKPSKEQAIGRARDVLGVLDRMVNIIPIACACGVNLKIPPTFGGHRLRCPRCGRQHDVPTARQPKADQSKGKKPEPGLSFRRKGEGWESFKCPCGGVIQLSPSFSAEYTSCRKCSRHIRIL